MIKGLTALQTRYGLDIIYLIDENGPQTHDGLVRMGLPASSAYKTLRLMVIEGFLENGPGGRCNQKPYTLTERGQEVADLITYCLKEAV